MALRDQFTEQLKTAMKRRRRAARLHAAHDHGQAQGHRHRRPPEGRRSGAGRGDRRDAARHGEVPPRERRPLPQGNRDGARRQGGGRNRGDRGVPAAADGRARRCEAAVAAAIAETGAAGVKDMGKVMAALKAKHGGALDMATRRRRLGEGPAGRLMALPAALPGRAARPHAAAGADRAARAAGALGAAMEGLLPVPRREDAVLLRLRRPLPLLRLRRARRCDQLRHADAGRRASSRPWSSSPPKPGWTVPKPTPGSGRGGARARPTLTRRAGSRRGRLPAPAVPARRGAPALAYLRGRGLSEETIRALRPRLVGRGARRARRPISAPAGVEQRSLVEAGLMSRRPSSGAVDMFFNRVMFPIRDRRGGAASASAGASSATASRNTSTAGNRAVLQAPHALWPATSPASAVRKGATLLVVEGYMDVIALHQAGFAGAVAPLGTALTEEQLDRALAPAPGAGAVLRRRRRRRAGPRRGRRTGAAAADAGTLGPAR